ncbi:MAG: glycosyltransferase family 4 protein [Verrucomicrobiota bacterium]
MNPSAPNDKRRFVVATPARTVCDDNARVLEKHGALRFLALGTRHGSAGIPAERTRLNPAIGLAAYLAARVFSTYHAESFRFRLHPWFDRWVSRQLRPGDHVLSTYGCANDCFTWARAHGGRTFLDGGNSHPDHFWRLLKEEHERWKCPLPPVAPHHYERSRAMMEHVDFVLSPSAFVTQSFLAAGFKPEQILKNVYPVDLSCFQPAPQPRPKDRPLSIISTGMLSLRKGTPYLLEAFRLIHARHPSARFLLTRSMQTNVLPVLAQYADLPIDWSPPLPHPELAQRLQSADLFLLPSLEEGLARTALEAMACGLPVIVTPHTGANDFVQPGVNGEIVPIRDPRAIADAILKWADRLLSRAAPPTRMIDADALSFADFEHEFLRQLQSAQLL